MEILSIIEIFGNSLTFNQEANLVKEFKEMATILFDFSKKLKMFGIVDKNIEKSYSLKSNH